MPLILPTPEQPEISPLQKAKQECKSEQGMGGAHAKLGNGMEQKGVAAEKAINTTDWGGRKKGRLLPLRGNSIMSLFSQGFVLNAIQ